MKVLRHLLGLLMFLAGVAIVVSFQLKAAERPDYGLRALFRPVWREPSCNCKPLFWIGALLWVASSVLMLVGH